MKATTFFLIISSLFLMSCSNTDEDTLGGSPAYFHFYIELSNTVGEYPADGEISLFYPIYVENGVFLEHPEQNNLIELVVVDDAVSNVTGKTLFGNSIAPDGRQGLNFGMCTGELSQNIDITKAGIIQYNESTADTLTIRSYGVVGDICSTYEFRLNGELIDVNRVLGGDAYFSIVKDIEWENIQEN